MEQIELSEAWSNLIELVNRAIGGQEIVITENHLPLLKLVRIADPQPKRALGLAEGQVWMADDFNDSYEDWIEPWEEDQK